MNFYGQTKDYVAPLEMVKISTLLPAAIEINYNSKIELHYKPFEVSVLSKR